MRQLRVVLTAEGPSDDAFLAPVVTRLLEDVCARRHLAVEVLPCHPVRVSGGGLPADARLGRLLDESGQPDLLVVHSDAAQEDRGRAVVEALRAAGQAALLAVPRRETEAWALADEQAVVAATGRADVRVPPHPEKVVDAKVVLRSLASRRRRRRPDPQELLAVLGQRVRLDELRALPSFERLVREVEVGVDALHLPGDSTT